MPDRRPGHEPQPVGPFTAILRGKGAVAQALQRAIALATRSVYIPGKNSGIVNTGFLLTINCYLGSVKARPNKVKLAHKLHAYLEWLQRYCNESGVPFESERVDGRTTQAAKPIDLEHTFVPLDILECSAQELHPAPCGHLLSLAGNRNALLLTDAGRGKTITLLHLAHQLCRHLLLKRGWEDDNNLRETLGLNSYLDFAVPFYVPLNVFAQELRDKGQACVPARCPRLARTKQPEHECVGLKAQAQQPASWANARASFIPCPFSAGV